MSSNPGHSRTQADATTAAPTTLALSRAGGGVRGARAKIDAWLRSRGLEQARGGELSRSSRRASRQRNLPAPILGNA